MTAARIILWVAAINLAFLLSELALRKKTRRSAGFFVARVRGGKGVSSKHLSMRGAPMVAVVLILQAVLEVVVLAVSMAIAATFASREKAAAAH